MVARAVRNVHPLAAALLWTALLGGCAGDLGSVAQREGVPMLALLRLSDEFAVAARPAGNGVEVVAFAAVDGGVWSADVIASGSGGGSDAAAEVTAYLVSMGGETGQEWNSFFFGTAPEAASRVVVDGLAATGGRVEHGAWVLAFRHRDVVPRQLAWRVLDATGGVIASGTGITR